MKRWAIAIITFGLGAAGVAFFRKPAASIQIIDVEDAFPRAMSWNGEFLALRGKGNSLVAYSTKTGATTIPDPKGTEDATWTCVANDGTFYGLARRSGTKAEIQPFSWRQSGGIQIGKSGDLPEGYVVLAVDESSRKYLVQRPGDWNSSSFLELGQPMRPLPVLNKGDVPFAGRMSRDGSVVSGCIDDRHDRKPAIWVRDHLEVVPVPPAKSPIAIRSMAQVLAIDPTGSAAVVTGPSPEQAYRWTGGKLTTIYDFTPKQIAPKLTGEVRDGMEMARLPPFDTVEFKCISHEGKRIYGTHHGGQFGEIETALVWTEDQGLVNLTDWLKRNYRIDVHKLNLAGVQSATSDGRTLIGYGVEGKKLKTFILHLPE